MTTYALNSPDVIAETIDGETILVNLVTGAYYSIEGSGADIWAGLMSGRDATAIAAGLVDSYDADESEIEAAVARLLDDLRGEQIVVEATPRPGGDSWTPSRAGERRPFVAPTLKKFTDMQDIILLDPVHEVDQRGWPHRAEEADARAAG
jgi:hypothetical protein